MSLTASRARPGPADQDPHREGVYAPVVAEVDAPALEIVGELPPELTGEYLRNGPNPRFAPIGRYLYPFDGDGMVHRVVLDGGRARYTNRFVRTPAVVAEEAAGCALWPGVTDPYRPGAADVGPALAGSVRPLPDINVVRHAGRLLALAESDLPFRLDADLATLGAETFDGSQPLGITAHPTLDPRTGELVVFCYHQTPPFLTWSTIGPDGRGSEPVPVDGVGRPTLIHDMALTEHFVVLVLAPLHFDPLAARQGGALMSWEPDAGTRIAVVPRGGGPVRWCATETFWTWHSAGAYELDDPQGGNPIVLDYVEWAAPAGVVPGLHGHGRLARAVIDHTAGTVRRTLLSDDRVEFPRIDDRQVTGRHAVIATAGVRDPDAADAAPDTLRWSCPDTGRTESWHAGDLAVGEPAFAPDPDTTDPDRGWWLTFATHRATGESWLLVIPAADPSAGPQARVRMPVRVPLGLHGAWLPTAR